MFSGEPQWNTLLSLHEYGRSLNNYKGATYIAHNHLKQASIYEESQR